MPEFAYYSLKHLCSVSILSVVLTKCAVLEVDCSIRVSDCYTRVSQSFKTVYA